MAILIVVPFQKVPEGASYETRKAMYESWLAAQAKANPRYYNSDGSTKSWWRALLNV